MPLGKVGLNDKPCTIDLFVACILASATYLCRSLSRVGREDSLLCDTFVQFLKGLQRFGLDFRRCSALSDVFRTEFDHQGDFLACFDRGRPSEATAQEPTVSSTRRATRSEKTWNTLLE